MTENEKKDEIMKIIRDIECADVYFELKRIHPDLRISDDEVTVLVDELISEDLVTKSRGCLILSSPGRGLMDTGGYVLVKAQEQIRLQEGHRRDKKTARSLKWSTIIQSVGTTVSTMCAIVSVMVSINRCEEIDKLNSDQNRIRKEIQKLKHNDRQLKDQVQYMRKHKK